MSDRTPVIAANWKMNKTIAGGDASSATAPAAGRGRGAPRSSSARRTSRCRAVAEATGGGTGRGRRAEHALRAVGRLHRRGLGGDAPRRRRDRGRARPLRAPAALRRDRRGAVPQGPGRARGGPDADPLRRRDRGRARARRDRPDPAPPDRRGPLAGRRSSGSPTSWSPTSRSGRSAPGGPPRPSRPRTPAASSAR